MQEHISAKDWHQACSGWGVAEVFEALIKLDIHYSDKMIWGDKSPSYISHVQLLKHIYPEAKIIHIIRDVRDHCLSTNKAWGKNMIRAAQRWNDDTIKASNDIQKLDSDGIEIRYEDLLSDVEDTLTGICDFLGITYEEAMPQLKKPSENIGEAHGKTKVVTQNKEKWRTQMSPRLIHRIESICTTQLTKYDYSIKYKGSPQRVSKLKLYYYQFLDGINLITHDTDNRGVFKNLIFYLRYKKLNSST